MQSEFEVHSGFMIADVVFVVDCVAVVGGLVVGPVEEGSLVVGPVEVGGPVGKTVSARHLENMHTSPWSQSSCLEHFNGRLHFPLMQMYQLMDRTPKSSKN